MDRSKANGGKLLGWLCIGFSAVALLIVVGIPLLTGKELLFAVIPAVLTPVVPGIILIAGARKKTTTTV